MSFDETNLVPNTGQLPPEALAERIESAELIRKAAARQGGTNHRRLVMADFR